MGTILEFFDAQKLYLNYAKTNFIVFHSPYMKTNEPKTIQIREETICLVTQIKYLGLVMDEHLKWDRHCEALESKLASVTGILWKLRYKLPQTTKKLIYNTLFETHLNYMSVIYGTACDNVISPIQKVQNRALRHVYNIEMLENRINLYAHLVQNCLPVRAINFVNSATYVYNNIKNKIHTNIIFERVASTSRTRQAGDLIKSESKTKYGQKRISSFGVGIYRSIPQDIRHLPHMHAFKWALKCYIRNEKMMSSFLSGDYLKSFGK